MKLNQWSALAHSHTLPLADQLELLMLQRQMLFEYQQELHERQAALTHQRHELIERQTAHHLQSRLFWLRLRQAALVRQMDEGETMTASEHTPPCGVPAESLC